MISHMALCFKKPYGKIICPSCEALLGYMSYKVLFAQALLFVMLLGVAHSIVEWFFPIETLNHGGAIVHTEAAYKLYLVPFVALVSFFVLAPIFMNLRKLKKVEK